MPLALQTNLPPNLRLGLWRIDAAELPGPAPEHIRHPAKQAQWLAARQCARQLLDLAETESLSADVHGRPLIPGDRWRLSITHTRRYAAVIGAPHGDVGLDAEALDATRDLHTATYFMNAEELALLHAAPAPHEWFFLVWCVKEAVYKLLNYRLGRLSFQGDIAVAPDARPLASEGFWNATVRGRALAGGYLVYDGHLFCHVHAE